MNKNEDVTHKNVWSFAKAVLREKFIAGNVYILKKKGQINDNIPPYDTRKRARNYA